MKLGLVTPGWTFEVMSKNIAMAGRLGYECLELDDIDFFNIDGDGIK